MASRPFTQEQLQALADALGETSEGLTGSEIGHLLRSAKMVDVDPSLTKRHRLYNAFVHHQNRTQDHRNILAFIRKAMKPASYVREPERFEPMRLNVNRALAFAGMQVDAAACYRGPVLYRLFRKQNAARAEFNCVKRSMFALCHKGHPWRDLLSGKPGAVHTSMRFNSRSLIITHPMSNLPLLI